MIYQIIGENPIALTTEIVYYFDDTHCYINKLNEGSDPHGVLVPYVPTTAEAEAWYNMIKEWQAFADMAPAVDQLTKLDFFKKYLNSVVEIESAKFESNLNKDMYFISSNGFKVNGDRRTRSNIQDLITFFDFQAQDGHVSYRDYDNEERSLTKQQLTTMMSEHVVNGQKLYKQKWLKQKAIADAKSFDDLHAITTDFEMSDFTKEGLSA